MPESKIRLLIIEDSFQVQKMEAIGRLAGGLAHDSNNLLSIIIGNLDFAMEQITDSEIASALEEALQAALRGAELNLRLLAFARRQALLPEAISVNALIDSASRLLKQALGQSITLQLELEADPDTALVDPAQLEATITNLVVNARDAMPQGGKLRISTRRHHLASDEAAGNGLDKAGDYIVVEVSDSGPGMTPDVQKCACEPFFTTKDEGRGTGLGLSVTHGFMQQSGGALRIASKMSEGTTVALFLPAAAAHLSIRPAIQDKPADGEGKAVLVAEDNERLRRILVRQLQALGYKTIEAAEGKSAVEILESDRQIDLLLTDLAMPGGMDGQQVAGAAAMLRPGIKVILTSGYAEAFIDRDGVGGAELLLRKPYRREELARVLQKAFQD